MLEAIRFLKIKNIKFYQASTSELFGETYGKNIFSEKSKFHPKSPYGVAKFIHIGLLQFIENHMVFLLVMEFYLITKVQEEEKLLLLEKLQDF